MATFKVGQRVWLVAKARQEDVVSTPILKCGMGAQGVIIMTDTPWPHLGDCVVLWDKVRSSHSSGGAIAYFYQLAPLTDPGADAFIERIKKLKPEPVVPLPEKIKASL